MTLNKKQENFDLNKEEQSILIVDDVPKNIQILGNMLLREGYNLSYAQSGEEAIFLVKNNQYDLILLDIMMPGMDGFEVCRLIREDSKSKQSPIIFLTAKTDKESTIKGLKIGAQDYITKPFSSEELLARVKTQLSLRSQQQQLQSINITLEKKVEERTKQLKEANEQLKSLEKAKSDFLSIISHELRTPLNGILGLTDLLQNTLNTDESAEYIEYLKEASQRLSRFSETAILITTLKSDQYRFHFTPQKLTYLLDNLDDTFKKTLIEKEIEFKTSDYPDELLINIDFDLIKTCLENILDNAIKFSEKKSRITLNVISNKESVELQISDQGPGFSKEAKERLFEYFSNANIANLEGTGLSLAATKLIMDAHQGKIEIANNEKSGACVSLRIPK